MFKSEIYHLAVHLRGGIHSKEQLCLSSGVRTKFILAGLPLYCSHLLHCYKGNKLRCNDFKEGSNPVVSKRLNTPRTG